MPTEDDIAALSRRLGELLAPSPAIQRMQRRSREIEVALDSDPAEVQTLTETVMEFVASHLAYRHDNDLTVPPSPAHMIAVHAAVAEERPALALALVAGAAVTVLADLIDSDDPGALEALRAKVREAL